MLIILYIKVLLHNAHAYMQHLNIIASKEIGVLKVCGLVCPQPDLKKWIIKVNRKIT